MQLDQHRGLSGGLEDHEVLDQAQPDLQDHELDAILGELSELETQFSKEITIEERKRLSHKE